MSTTAAPTPAAPAESLLQKIWDWIKGKVTIVEEEIAKVLGPTVTQDLESIGKTLLDSWIGPLAVSAMTEATDVVTGQMSISKAVSGLISLASSSGKSLTAAAALQAIALAQNALPTKADPTVTPVA